MVIWKSPRTLCGALAASIVVFTTMSAESEQASSLASTCGRRILLMGRGTQPPDLPASSWRNPDYNAATFTFQGTA